MKKNIRIITLIVVVLFCFTISPVVGLAANIQEMILQTESESETIKTSEVETETESGTEVQSEKQFESQAETELITEEQDFSETETEAKETEQTEAKKSNKQDRAVASVSRYMAVREQEGNAKDGATIYTEGSLALPKDYTGYIVSSLPRPSVNYSVQDESGQSAYNMSKMANYNEDEKDAGKLYAIYPNALNYNGVHYDVRLTIADWEFQTNRIDENQPATLRFSNKRPGIHVNRIYSVHFYMEFFEHGTTTPVNAKGYVTYRDVDHQQGIVFQKGYDKFFVGSQAKGNIGYSLTKAGNPYFYDKGDSDSVTEKDITNWMTATFNGARVDTVFTFFNITEVDGKRVISNNSSDGAMDLDSTKLIRGPISIQKYVTDTDEKLVISDTLNQQPQPRKEDFYYTLVLRVPPESTYTYYKSLEVTDKIDKGLKINSAGIKIADENEADVTSYFHITVDSSNKLAVIAKADKLASSSFYEHSYSIKVPVNIKDSTDLTAYWDEGKQMARIDNKCSVTYDSIMINSNEVHTYVPDIIPPEGAIEIIKVDSADQTASISGVTFQIYEWSKATGKYKTEVYDTLAERILLDGVTKGYVNSKEMRYTSDNEYKFRVEEVKAAVGYLNTGWAQEVRFSSAEPTKRFQYTVENEQMDPQLKVAKAFDKTTVGDMVSGKYEGEKESGWYDFSEDAKATLTISNTGNVAVKDIVVTEKMSKELSAVILDGSAQYIIPADIKTTKGHDVTLTIDPDNSDILYISELEPKDSLVLDYKVTIFAREHYTDQQLELLRNVVTVTGVYANGKEDMPLKEDQDEDKLNIYNAKTSITKAADKELYGAGEKVIYTMTISNDGNTNLINLKVEDIMDRELAAAVEAGTASFDAISEAETQLGHKVTFRVENSNILHLDELQVNDKVTFIFTITLKKREIETFEALKNTVRVTGEYGEGKKVIEDEDDTAEAIINVSYGYVQVTKKSSKDNKKLADAEFEIYNNEDEVVETLKTDENGIAKSGELLEKVYYLKEIKAPDGYELSDKKYEFKITKHQQIVEVEVKNDPESKSAETKRADKKPIENKVVGSKAVKTGDNSNIHIYVLIMACTFLMIIILQIKKLRHKQK